MENGGGGDGERWLKGRGTGREKYGEVGIN